MKQIVFRSVEQLLVSPDDDPLLFVIPLMLSVSGDPLAWDFDSASTVTEPPAMIVVPVPIHAHTTGFEVAVADGAPIRTPSDPPYAEASESASASSSSAVTPTLC